MKALGLLFTKEICNIFLYFCNQSYDAYLFSSSSRYHTGYIDPQGRNVDCCI